MSIIKKLPKIYQPDIDKPIKNNRESYYSLSSKNEDRSNTMSSSDILLILDGIFSGEKHAYNIPVIIKTSTKVYDTFLIARTGGYLLSRDHDKIKVEDIISIQRKNP